MLCPLLGLPTRTLERVAACPCVTQRVTEVILRPQSIDEVRADAENASRFIALCRTAPSLDFDAPSALDMCCNRTLCGPYPEESVKLAKVTPTAHCE